MSLILDALRKSEAARRRSETPDLFSSMPQATEPTRALAGWPLWAFGAASAAAVLIAVWWFAGRGSDDAVPPPETDAASVSATTPSPDDTTAPRRDAALSPPPPMPGPAPGTVANIGPAPSPNLPTPSSAATAPRGDAPSNDATQPSRPEAPSPAVVVTDPLPVPPPPAVPASPPATDRIASLAELDPETRKQLPPLKLSMHLWNDTASQRFVVLDGQRLKEGDVLGELVVERITRDGVVLAWRGARLRLDR